ncbi:MAG: 23S rRNA (guanosine(2251)-2'-O)-methyltransferase RlmB [Acidobacteria bacterium]|nr:MAG: 23S rRNA (guanosine(2251)-2'-O)-methyltransferase RlmB [Acidobacteriota bacterium]
MLSQNEVVRFSVSFYSDEWTSQPAYRPRRPEARRQRRGVAGCVAESEHPGLVHCLRWMLSTESMRWKRRCAHAADKNGKHIFVVVLDGVEDPHNLGALIRTADGAGVDGVVIPERRAAAVNATVAKASAGASEHVNIARVVNLARALEEMKERNIWIVGLDERGDRSYDQLDYRMDCAMVLGAEGHGLHDLVRKKCDYLVSIPMAGKVPSLNVSVAGAIVMYEVARQRRALDTVSVDRPAKQRKGLGS